MSEARGEGVALRTRQDGQDSLVGSSRSPFHNIRSATAIAVTKIVHVLPLQLQGTTVFVVFLIILLIRPQGLFGRNVERA